MAGKKGMKRKAKTVATVESASQKREYSFKPETMVLLSLKGISKKCAERVVEEKRFEENYVDEKRNIHIQVKISTDGPFFTKQFPKICSFMPPKKELEYPFVENERVLVLGEVANRPGIAVSVRNDGKTFFNLKMDNFREVAD